MNIEITSRSGRPLATVKVDKNATIGDLKNEFRKEKRVKVERQYFNIRNEDGSRGEALPVDNGKKLCECQVQDGATLLFKDLGPQFSWRGVFLIEYFGSLVAFPLVYLLQVFIYGDHFPLQETQTIAMALFVFHFLKRELETLLVHKFSSGYMPIFNLFKNSSYYWGYAFFVAYFVLHPQFTSPNMMQVYIGAAGMVIFELMNLYCHIYLSNLRPAGTTVRKIPRGFLFELVSCPNYLCEILAWVSFTIMTNSLPSLLFTLSGAGQMLIWALGKHKRYRKEFPDYPRRRKALIPFVI